ncbi:uncharacterized protein G2W53_039721 [Senna tora]|uniref:Uncharacterized protein n=1 Tax=Senna tora TaxID=362788 RepID=A0A834W330_9FABA|nr:uncharacterized protein G2W53_039721 [Senna tora]
MAEEEVPHWATCPVLGLPVEVELKLAAVSAQTDLIALLLSVSATPMVPNTTGRQLLGLTMKKSVVSTYPTGSVGSSCSSSLSELPIFDTLQPVP